MPIPAGYGELTQSVIIAIPDRSNTSAGQPSLVAGTMAGGPPAATVSRDISLCPTWKQRPHSAHYSRWSAVAGSQTRGTGATGTTTDTQKGTGGRSTTRKDTLQEWTRPQQRSPKRIHPD
ncbi:hypothetical protein PIB30_074993 [Stylosanthes scabra]|uniref:Uncharacterized protein n=1 Tax=Stylosanthes scabra TaxID=79078 RepID=A0ABU6RQ61_9FABA|nr:hypothetical protein [Stylosanthes scabra]